VAALTPAGGPAAGPRPYDVVTFDCYGTLVDWAGGIREAFAAAARAQGATVELARAMAVYLEVEPVVQAEGYRRYRDVLAETARRVAPRLGWALPAERAGFLAESVPGWRPFPDTNAALERLARAGYALGILSNIDDDLLAATRRHLTTPFEFVVTAEGVKSYKPAPGHFEAARARVGGRRWLHAAESYFHDVVPARALGIPTAWVNRTGARPTDGGRADRELTSLADLADWLAPAG
jgi:2-haloalkanoic acid dehalogenase type II